MAESSVCVCCNTDPCACPKSVQNLKKLKTAYFDDNEGNSIFWPRISKKEDGRWYLSCYVCANFNSGVSFHSNSRLRTGDCDIIKSKVCKTTIDDHTAKGDKGDHGLCIANYLAIFRKEDGKEDGAVAKAEVPETRAAKRAAQNPPKELLNHFAWLYSALAMPISENKFQKMMHVANETKSEILTNQYLGKHFFAEGLTCLDRVVGESVFKILKKAKKIAWHMDVGGGVLLVRFFALNSSYQRETHFIQARKLGSHTAKAMFEGFIRSLTQPTKSLTQDEVLTEKEFCEKTVVFLADGASSMGVRAKGAQASKAVAGDNVLHLLQAKINDTLGDAAKDVVGYCRDVPGQGRLSNLMLEQAIDESIGRRILPWYSVALHAIVFDASSDRMF